MMIKQRTNQNRGRHRDANRASSMRGNRNRSMLTCAFLSILVVLGGCAASGTSAGGSDTGELAARSAEDIARDTGRKPFTVLDYLGVQPGMTVMDVIASGGYYTEVLANAVGPTGRVYAQNPAVSLRFRGAANDRAMNARVFAGRLPNVRRLDRGFEDLGLRENSVDVAITALNFHDVYNNSPQAAQQVLASIMYVLKPGGVLGIIDHVGNPGADHARLHRMDPVDAIAAAEAAGFSVLQSDLLANPDDDHTQSPFAEGLRGNTDRFLLKLVKPS